VVGSVADSGFEVIRPDGERAWLRYDCIFSVIYSVRLICEEHGFDRWRLPGRRAG